MLTLNQRKGFFFFLKGIFLEKGVILSQFIFCGRLISDCDGYFVVVTFSNNQKTKRKASPVPAGNPSNFMHPMHVFVSEGLGDGSWIAICAVLFSMLIYIKRSWILFCGIGRWQPQLPSRIICLNWYLVLYCTCKYIRGLTNLKHYFFFILRYMRPNPPQMLFIIMHFDTWGLTNLKYYLYVRMHFWYVRPEQPHRYVMFRLLCMERPKETLLLSPKSSIIFI